MIQYKCKSCGGQLDIGGSGSFECPYCGSKSFMSDADFKNNEIFRKKMLQYVRAKVDEKENDYSEDVFWEAKNSISFEMANSRPLNIDYMFESTYNKCKMYLAHESVVYIFDNANEANTFKNGLKQVAFPEADTKLSRCFPELKMEIDLKDNRKVLVYTRRPGFYPASLFSPWPSEHLAWVISRMENICCTFEYSEIQHNGIDSNAIFINPVTHEGAIFGDWRKITEKKSNADLIALRKTAIELAENSRNPIELYNFLNSSPADNAFDDFEQWDLVIEKGFGGHKFVKMQRN